MRWRGPHEGRVGTDTGQTATLMAISTTGARSYVGWDDRLRPIVAATRDSAEIAKVNSGLIAPGRTPTSSCSTPIR